LSTEINIRSYLLGTRMIQCTDTLLECDKSSIVSDHSTVSKMVWLFLALFKPEQDNS
jgi:hypothetical protein